MALEPRENATEQQNRGLQSICKTAICTVGVYVEKTLWSQEEKVVTQASKQTLWLRLDQARLFQIVPSRCGQNRPLNSRWTKNTRCIVPRPSPSHVDGCGREVTRQH
eukprot:4317016-Amphidinium_carterae.1